MAAVCSSSSIHDAADNRSLSEVLKMVSLIQKHLKTKLTRVRLETAPMLLFGFPLTDGTQALSSKWF